MADELCAVELACLKTERDRSRAKSFGDRIGAALRAFDKAAEWADLIKYLQALLSVLEKYRSVPVVPLKMSICRRVNQCLNHLLPGGVHSKALEVYEHMFARIHPEVFAQEIGMYSVGIFALFPPATMTVKPKILKLIDQYYLPQKKFLIPCLKGLVMSLLSGIEEQSSEFYPQVLQMLDTIRRDSDETEFFRAVWKSLMQNGSVRFAALHYLKERLPPISADTMSLIPDKDTLVLQALVQSLRSDKILVQRETLELICTHFKLDSQLFVEPTLHILIAAALQLVIRREVSLNRRLYNWLLGIEKGAQSDPDFFVKYSKASTLMAIKELFNSSLQNPTSESQLLQPIRVIECLVDKDEIGVEILDGVLEDVLHLIFNYRDANPFSQQVTKAVSAFLESLELARLWKFLCQYIHSDLNKADSKFESIPILDSILQILSSNSTEDFVTVVSVCLPQLLLSILTGLPNLLQTGNWIPLQSALQLSLKILGKIPAREIQTEQNSPTPKVSTSPGNYPHDIMFSCARGFVQFFIAFCKQVDITHAHITSQHEMVSIFALFTNILLEIHSRSLLHHPPPVAVPVEKTNSGLSCLIPALSPLLEADIKQELHHLESQDVLVLPEIDSWFQCLSECFYAESGCVVCIAVKTFIQLLKVEDLGEHTFWKSFASNTTLKEIVKKLWSLLHHSSSEVHYEVAEIFLSLELICDQLIFDSFSQQMLEGSIQSRVEAYQRFALLWRLTGEVGATQVCDHFSPILFHMLATLHDDNPDIVLTGKTWLADSINRAERILDPIMRVLLDLSTLRKENCQYEGTYDTKQVLYMLKLLKVIIECDFRVFMEHVTNKTLSKDIAILNVSHSTPGGSAGGSDFLFIPTNNYIDLIIVVAVRFIQGIVPDESNKDFLEANAIIQTTATDLIQFILLKLTNPVLAKNFANLLQTPVLQALAQAVSGSNLVLQVHLLLLMRTIVQLDAMDVTNPQQQQVQEPVSASPMFMQTLIVGLLQPSHKNVRFYWLEFVTTCLPYLSTTSTMIVGPVLQCLCDIVSSFKTSIFDSLAVKDILMLLKAIDTILKYSTDRITESNKSEAEAKGASQGLGPLGLGFGAAVFGFFKDAVNVSSSLFFGSEAKVRVAVGAMRDIVFSLLPLVMQALFDIYATTEVKQTQLLLKSPIASDRVQNKYTIQDQVERIMEPLLQQYPNEVASAILSLLEKDSSLNSVVIGLLNSLSFPVDATVTAFGAVVIGLASSRAAKKTQSSLREEIALAFMSQYLEQAQPVEQVLTSWPQVATLVRQCANLWSMETVLPLINLAHVFFNRTVATEDKKHVHPSYNSRRERQDLIQRLFDVAISALASSDPHLLAESQQPVITGFPGLGVFMPPSTVASISAATSNTGPANSSPVVTPRGGEAKPLEKVSTEDVKDPQHYQISVGIFKALTVQLLPLMDSLFDDKEKEKDPKIPAIMNTLLPPITALVHYKGPGSPPNVEAAVKFVSSICQYNWAARHWKNLVNEVFNDNDFFAVEPQHLLHWMIPVNTLVAPVFTEFLKSLMKVLQPPTLLTAREQDMINKSRWLRRLAFVLLSAPLDHYSKYKNQIREQLVSVLRIPNYTMVHCQVFHCLRVMFIKFSGTQVQYMWPLALSELIGTLSRQSAVDVDAELTLAACKLLDLLLVMPDSVFMQHEWVFLYDCLHSKLPRGAFVPLIERMYTYMPETQKSPVLNFAQLAGTRQPLLSSVTTPLNPHPLPPTTQNIANTRLLLHDFSHAAKMNQLFCFPLDAEYVSRSLTTELSTLEQPGASMSVSVPGQGKIGQPLQPSPSATTCATATPVPSSSTPSLTPPVSHPTIAVPRTPPPPHTDTSCSPPPSPAKVPSPNPIVSTSTSTTTICTTTTAPVSPPPSSPSPSPSLSPSLSPTLQPSSAVDITCLPEPDFSSLVLQDPPSPPHSPSPLNTDEEAIIPTPLREAPTLTEEPTTTEQPNTRQTTETPAHTTDEPHPDPATTQPTMAGTTAAVTIVAAAETQHPDNNDVV
ncbi:Protein dopey [Pelomyxa schiedti]|nr:Protein dopey [Pelomyxa schiedti]